MKKIIAIIVFYLGCIGILEAQFIQKPYQITKKRIMTYDDTPYEVSLTGTYQYNEQGLISQFEYTAVNTPVNSWVPWGYGLYRKNFWYDDQSHLIKCSSNAFDEYDQLSDTTYYWYNGDLLTRSMKRELMYHWYNWYVSDSTEYHYDNEGRLSQVVKYSSELPDEWELPVITNYYWNEAGCEIIWEKPNYNGEWIQARSITHRDLDDNIIDVLYESYREDGSVASGYAINYGYDNGLCHTKIRQKWVAEDTCWVNDSSYVFYYDNQGRRIERLIQNWVDNNWQNTERTRWEIDEDGLMQNVTKEQWIDSTFVNYQRAEYQYDENELCIGMRGFGWSSDFGWVSSPIGYYDKQPPFFWDESLRNEDKLMRTEWYHFTDATITWQKLYPVYSPGSEWYYEIKNDNGSITYQHLQHTGDTVMMGKRPKIIVRSNTHYDKEAHTEVTHEYIYEENGKVYWWNKTLQEFTTLYDLTAEVGDEWEIKVGNESLIMHVDAEGRIDYEGRSYRTIHVRDENDLFSGDIVCGIGHLTSFFPERLMFQGKGYRVDGLRCYWVNGSLNFRYGNRDCDEVYEQLHHGLNETSENGFAVYPNPTRGTLFVETQNIATLTNPTYRITNLMGQTLMQGTIHTETQQIDISNLPTGMYFFSVSEQTVKLIKW